MENKLTNYSFFACALFAFAALGCVNEIDTDPKNLIGRWQMVKVIDQGKSISKPDRSTNPNEMEVEFFEDGSLKGTLPAEEFDGHYKVWGDDSISISCSKSSKRGVSEWGSYFFYNARLITTFSLQKKKLNFEYGELYLNYVNSQLIFDKVE